jgi:cell wall-associated NlpC family hydrolase
MKISRYITYFFFSVLGVLVSCKSSKKLTTANEHNSKSKGTNSNSSISSQIKKKYSTILQVDEQKIKSVPLYALIDEWYGTAYKYGGCDKSGIDCSNFAAVIYQEIYSKSLKGSSAAIFNQCIAVSKNELEEGDLVFFKIEKNTISHIGIYLQNNKFVHATTKKGVMIDDLNEAYYAKSFYKGGRLK